MHAPKHILSPGPIQAGTPAPNTLGGTCGSEVLLQAEAYPIEFLVAGNPLHAMSDTRWPLWLPMGPSGSIVVGGFIT